MTSSVRTHLPALAILLGLGLAAFAAACAPHHVKVDPISVKPIHVDVDVVVHDGDKPDHK